MTRLTLPPPPLDRLTTALAAVVVALTLTATVAQAQNACTTAKCLMTLQSVSPVADGCGEHATPARIKLTLASSQTVIYNQGKRGRYATLFPSSDPATVPVDPASETRNRGDFPTTVFAEIGRDPMVSDDVFEDWEWRNENSNRGAWQRVPPTRWGISAPDIGENIYEVRPVAGAHIWGKAGELELTTLRLTPVATATASGRAYVMFTGGKGCARVGPGGGLLGGNQ